MFLRVSVTTGMSLANWSGKRKQPYSKLTQVPCQRPTPPTGRCPNSIASSVPTPYPADWPLPEFNSKFRANAPHRRLAASRIQ
jgi:hypothetical protein